MVIYYPPADFTDQLYENMTDPAREILEKLNADAPITYNDTSFTIGDTPATAANSGYVSVGAQAFAGEKTFGPKLNIKHASATNPVQIESYATDAGTLRATGDLDILSTAGHVNIQSFDATKDVTVTSGREFTVNAADDILVSETGTGKNLTIQNASGPSIFEGTITTIGSTVGAASTTIRTGTTGYIETTTPEIHVKNPSYGGLYNRISQTALGNLVLYGETSGKDVYVQVYGSSGTAKLISAGSSFVVEDSHIICNAPDFGIKEPTYAGSPVYCYQDSSGNFIIVGETDKTVSVNSLGTSGIINVGNTSNSLVLGQSTKATTLAGTCTFSTAVPSTSYAPTTGNHLVNKTYADGLAGTNYWKQYHLRSCDFLNPNNSDWAVNALAPSIADSSNNAISVRAFDDTTEEGIGHLVETPPSTTRMIFAFNFKMVSATSGNIVAKIYAREITRSGTPGSWTSYTIGAVAVPGTAGHWFRATNTIPYTSWGTALGADKLYQLEITRDAANASDTATGDMYIGFVRITFDNS